MVKLKQFEAAFVPVMKYWNMPANPWVVEEFFSVCNEYDVDDKTLAAVCQALRRKLKARPTPDLFGQICEEMNIKSSRASEAAGAPRTACEFCGGRGLVTLWWRYVYHDNSCSSIKRWVYRCDCDNGKRFSGQIPLLGQQFPGGLTGYAARDGRIVGAENNLRAVFRIKDEKFLLKTAAVSEYIREDPLPEVPQYTKMRDWVSEQMKAIRKRFYAEIKQSEKEIEPEGVFHTDVSSPGTPSPFPPPDSDIEEPDQEPLDI